MNKAMYTPLLNMKLIDEFSEEVRKTGIHKEVKK